MSKDVNKMIADRMKQIEKLKAESRKRKEHHEVAYQLMLDEEEARLTCIDRYDYASKVSSLCAMAESKCVEPNSRTQFSIKYLNPDVANHSAVIVSGVEVSTSQNGNTTTEFVDISELLLR